ncbi:ABC-type Fe3+-hydroxamate transport system, periplasmic component [Sanguibacter keddieii DSM 10542]|uniref:ABC-type Fe3+-hydroxamate transport system, periplasmic component n=1 Tax=Sanguibacter keddieii (strain ATCC 51767 / DSM 10542 / NCFB 3025 / ST-74) TaxID=446469 RepID=D1BJB6_SANKS|nr:putative F420-0 ABC transporter substrate-binding protein [Sanguibacter keddieii]ACZ22310.1 ABC-type Fe3+-hydroxamate transport system, periplasmic component [Sanguibacter keddieii DSM 10542]
MLPDRTTALPAADVAALPPTRLRHARTSAALAPVALAAAVVLTLAGCSGSAPTGGASSAGAVSETAAGAAGTEGATTYPVTVDNCGFEVTFGSAPQRVLTVKSSTTEMLLALGLSDRVVATAFPDGPVPAWLADAAAGNDAVATPLTMQAPGPEAVTEVEPDLVYAGWESNLTAESAGDRGTLATLGVSSYVSPSACKGEAYMPDPLTFDDVFADITEVGTVFDVPAAAEELVAQQRSELDAVVPDDRGLTVLWYSSGTDIPYVGAGIGAPQMIMDAAGLTNIAADVHDTWTPFGWEDVVAADPDVIVLVDAAWNTADSKIEMLEENAATANLTAVREQRYVVVPFAATEAGVRNVSAVVDLVERLGEVVPEAGAAPEAGEAPEAGSAGATAAG